MKNFNKKNYPGYFENMMKKYGKVFLCIEAVYDHEETEEKKQGGLSAKEYKKKMERKTA